MADDVILNKTAALERCIERVKEEYRLAGTDLSSNLSHQDALILNVLRACETAIDLAMHIARSERLGVPQSSRDGFALLETAGILPKDLSENLQRMVGFRNVVIHEYQKLDIEVLHHIVEKRLSDFQRYGAILIKRSTETNSERQ